MFKHKGHKEVEGFLLIFFLRLHPLSDFEKKKPLCKIVEINLSLDNVFFFFQHKQYEGPIWKCWHGWHFVLNKIIPKIINVNIFIRKQFQKILIDHSNKILKNIWIFIFTSLCNCFFRVKKKSDKGWSLKKKVTTIQKCEYKCIMYAIH